MDAIFIVSPEAEISLENLLTLKEGAGPFSREWPMDVYPLRADKGNAFTPGEAEQLTREGFKSVIQIDCHLDDISRMRHVLCAILSKYGGFVMYDDIGERFDVQIIESFNPGLHR
jgi:hypothetical protein